MKHFTKIVKSSWVIAVIYLLCFFTVKGNAQSNTFKVGAATTVITPELGHWVQGAGVSNRATKVVSDLEANAIYFYDGNTEILMVSGDLVGLSTEFTVRVRNAMAVAAGISPRSIIIAATHTHGGPVMIKTNYFMPMDTLYMKKLKGWLVDVAKQAVQSAQPAKIAWTTGKSQIGWNRRFTWADGTHTMYGDATRPAFTGLEGPADPQHTTLFAKDMSGNLIAIMYNNTTHPTTAYADGEFSSDFIGTARKKLREHFGRSIPVLFLNGAQGDIQSDHMPFRPDPWSNDKEKLQWFGNKLYKTIMGQYKEATYYNDDPALKHVYKDLKVGVRLPGPEQLIKSRRVMKRIKNGELPKRGMKMILAFGTVHLQEVYGDAPFDVLPIHAIRIGKLAIVTEPAELYSAFGLSIKRRSPALTTMVVGLADGLVGYVPTIYSLMGGGYSGQPISWTRMEPYAGYKIVETASILLNKLFPYYRNTDGQLITKPTRYR